MRSINEYLLAKNKTRYDEFPKQPSPGEVVEFLRDHDFKEIEHDENKASSVILMKFNTKEHSKPMFIDGYDKSTEDHYIAFCDKGDLSEDNPVFTCVLNDDCKEYDDSYYIEWPEKVDDEKSYTHWRRLSTYAEFVEKVNKFFEW